MLPKGKRDARLSNNLQRKKGLAAMASPSVDLSQNLHFNKPPGTSR